MIPWMVHEGLIWLVNTSDWSAWSSVRRSTDQPLCVRWSATLPQTHYCESLDGPHCLCSPHGNICLSHLAEYNTIVRRLETGIVYQREGSDPAWEKDLRRMSFHPFSLLNIIIKAGVLRFWLVLQCLLQCSSSDESLLLADLLCRHWLWESAVKFPSMDRLFDVSLCELV